MIVGKLKFASVSNYYGLEMCLSDWHGKVYDIDEKSAAGCDVIVVSLFWYRDILFLENFLRNTGLKNRTGKTIIIAGGLQATLSPELVAEMVDYVFVGDGEGELKNILHSIEEKKEVTSKWVYVKGIGTVPKPREVEKLDGYVHLVHGQKKAETQRKKKNKINAHRQNVSSIYRLEIARGCKFKCPFCMMSGLKKYREVSADRIIELINGIPYGATVALFAPERLCHSEWAKISAHIKKRKLKDYGQDVRLENIEKIETDSAILGLEGISYKLRKSVNKNFSNEFIIEKMSKFATTGRRIQYGGHLGIYYIADLPGENMDDWKEIKEFFKSISAEQWSRNLTIAPVLNPLSPKPFSLFAKVPVHPLRNYGEIWRTLLRGGDGNSRWGIKMKEYMIWGNWERVVDGYIHQGGKKSYKLIEKLNKNLLVKNPSDNDKSKRMAKDFIREGEKIGINPSKIFNNTDWANESIPVS